jgi:hypothetical protein
MMKQLHSQEPGEKEVEARLSLTIPLGAIQTSSERDEARKEFAGVLGWGEYPNSSISARMICVKSGRKRRIMRSIPVQEGSSGKKPKGCAAYVRSGVFMQRAVCVQ